MLLEIIESIIETNNSFITPIVGDVVKITNYGSDEENPDKWAWNGAKGEIIQINNNIYTIRITNLNNSNVKNIKKYQKKYATGKKLRKKLYLKRKDFDVIRIHELNKDHK